jgi:outer membrane protein OmpA-like peptidoglycan-associated protein
MPKATIIGLTAAFIAIFAAGAPAAEKSAGINEIIRSLAPLKYLPEHSGKRRAIDLDIPFELGSDRLTPRAKRQLDIVAEAFGGRELRSRRFQVIGHTDASGAAAANQSLSERRAKAVRRYLTKRHGIRGYRLQSLGRGEAEIKNTLSPEAAENRRVEFVLVEEAGTGDNPSANKSGQKVIKW